MSEPQQGSDEKLKELADSLSEELGGKATITEKEVAAATNVQSEAPASSSEDSDEISLDAMISSAPAAEPAKSPEKPKAQEPTASQKIEEAVEVLSLEELDKILDQQDPLFNQSMSELRKDLTKGDKALNVPGPHIASEILGIVDKDKESQQKPKPKLSFVAATAEKVSDSISHSIDRSVEVSKVTFKYVKEKSVKVPPLLKAYYLLAKTQTLRFLAWHKGLSRIRKANLYLFVVVSLALVVVVGRTIRGKPLLSPAPSALIRSFEEVADRIEVIKQGEAWEQFDSPLRNPEYVVLYKKMFVNLKSTSTNRNPMAAFEIFIEGDSQETAVELKDRERQFQDVIARVFESIPYDDIITNEGKNKLKLIIRRDLNQVLNKGRVKKVYFKTFFYKS